MPIKNTVKTYLKGGYYHLYNRGIDRREIFLEPQDCSMFLHFLKIYLSPPEVIQKSMMFLSPKLLFKILNRNLSKEIELLSFSLMPNHFHLQVKQLSTHGIHKLMRQITPSYVNYFNRKIHRIGTLFESTYKAVMTETEDQHLYLSSYIHRNGMKLKNPKFDFVQFSSYPYYLGEKSAEWVKPQEILSYFRTARNLSSTDILSYQNFVENLSENPEELLQDLVIEDE